MALNLYRNHRETIEYGNYVLCVAWNPPFEDSWRLHFSGVISTETEVAGGGCILRDQNGVFKAACAIRTEYCEDITKIKLKTVVNGLSIAINSGVDYLEIHGDDSTVIGLLKGEIIAISLEIQELLEKCFRLLDNIRSVSISTTPAYANIAATKLAVMGAQLGMYQLYSRPPPQIADVLVCDVIGRWIPKHLLSDD